MHTIQSLAMILCHMSPLSWGNTMWYTFPSTLEGHHLAQSWVASGTHDRWTWQPKQKRSKNPSRSVDHSMSVDPQCFFPMDWHRETPNLESSGVSWMDLDSPEAQQLLRNYSLYQPRRMWPQCAFLTCGDVAEISIFGPRNGHVMPFHTTGPNVLLSHRFRF